MENKIKNKLASKIPLRPKKYDKDGNLIKHLNYSKIEEFIYIGKSICCRYHFEKLLSIGIRADIDLQEEKIDSPSGVKAFLWLPTEDFTPPTQVQLNLGVNFLGNLVKHKIKCYVHCNEGHGRAPVLVAAYYIKFRGMSPIKAINKIKSRRKGVNPNKEQRRALEIFYKKYGPFTN